MLDPPLFFDNSYSVNLRGSPPPQPSLDSVNSRLVTSWERWQAEEGKLQGAWMSGHLGRGEDLEGLARVALARGR